MKNTHWLDSGPMNYARFTQRLALLIVLLLAVATPFARSKPGNTTSHMLTLNGKPLDYTRFSMYTKGVLALIAGDAKTNGGPKIPFRIYLQRGNQLIKSGGSIPNQSVSEIEVSQVLISAIAGDYLVIEPVRKEDANAKRSIKLTDYASAINCKWTFPYWLFGPRKSDGC